MRGQGGGKGRAVAVAVAWALAANIAAAQSPETQPAPGAVAPVPPPVVPSTASPPPALGTDLGLLARSDKLEGTLVTLANQNTSSAGTGVLQLLIGAAWVGLGTFFAFQDSDDAGNGANRVMGMTGTLIIGVPYMVSGVRTLVGVPSTDEERLVRFRQERQAGPLSAEHLAHYEGELQADAELSRKMRISRGYANIGAAAAGGALIGLTAAADVPEEGRVLGYVEGGVLLAFGTWDAISDFTGESNNEREWRLYRTTGSVASPRPAAFSIRPVVGATIGVAGTF